MTGHFGTAALPKLKAALEILEAYLSKTEWLAGSEVTLADIVAVVTVSCLEVVKIILSTKKTIKKHKYIYIYLHTSCLG